MPKPDVATNPALPPEEFRIREEAADLIYEIIDFGRLIEMASIDKNGNDFAAVARAASRMRANAEKLCEYI